jgi:hypothetical protein
VSGGLDGGCLYVCREEGRREGREAKCDEPMGVGDAVIIGKVCRYNSKRSVSEIMMSGRCC